MNNPERPPLDPYIYEQIEAELHAIDTVHWPLIAKMRVKNYHPLDVPIPPQQPKHLLNQIVWYAERLFKSEADRYEEFRNDGRYPAWLSRLVDRIKTRVLNAVDKIEHGESILSVQISTLMFHGLSQPDIEKGLQGTLREIAMQYEHGKVPVIVTEPTHPQPEPKQQEVTQKETLPAQIKLLQDECDITAETMAEALDVAPRSIFRHLAGRAVPRPKHIAAYEKLFSERLGRSVTLKKSVKRHRNVSQSQ